MSLLRRTKKIENLINFNNVRLIKYSDLTEEDHRFCRKVVDRLVQWTLKILRNGESEDEVREKSPEMVKKFVLEQQERYDLENKTTC